MRIKGRREMKDYLLLISYSQAAWAAMIKKPENRSEAVTKVVEKLGGKLAGFWLSFGDHDVVGMVQMPDDASAAAFAMAIAAGGACRSVKTIPLMSVAVGLEAMKKAAACGYKPVGAKKK
jgi:uncharacterized protein with GYD domain